ncbi:MAG: type II methionyl aminopeptidase [Candidatus Hadarchaeia archaeon]
MKEEELENYKKSGKLAADARDSAVEMAEPGEKLLEIAEKVENFIYEGGGEPAFPCNLSVDEKAAHYSPPADDETVLEEGDLLKIDVGAHIDGYIADTATTVCVGRQSNDMIQAVNEVLETAIDFLEPGVNVGDIGGVIEEAAEERGYRPINNLTGHTMERWSLHGGVSIPNVEKDIEKDLEVGDVIALEPFLTDGKGEVKNSPEVYIFGYQGNKGVSGRMARQTLRKISNEYGRFPFAERWLTRDLSRIRLQVTLRELINTKSLRPYYVLTEVEEGIVTQAEDTMVVTEEGVEITTKK